MPTITLKFKILSSETEFKTERAAGSNNYPEYQKTTKEAEQLLSEVNLDLDSSSEAEICQIYLNAPKYYHVLTEVLEHLRSKLKYSPSIRKWSR